MADIVGFGESGVYVALATGGGSFGPSSSKLANFGPSAGGWVNDTIYAAPTEIASDFTDLASLGSDLRTAHSECQHALHR
jgi:hypothetical protein